MEGGEVGSGRWGAKGGGSRAGLGRGRRIRRHRAPPRLLLDVEEERGGAATPTLQVLRNGGREMGKAEGR